jgi:hypothetical protein
LRGASPLWVRANHPPIPSVAVVRKVVQEERTEPNEAIEAYTGNHVARKGDRNPPSLDTAPIESRDESPDKQTAMVLTGQKPTQRAPRKR